MENPFETLLRRLDAIEKKVDLIINAHVNPSVEKPIYLKKREAADFIKTTPEALQQMVTRGRIPSIKRGRSLYFLETDLIEWLEQGRRKSK